MKINLDKILEKKILDDMLYADINLFTKFRQSLNKSENHLVDLITWKFSQSNYKVNRDEYHKVCLTLTKFIELHKKGAKSLFEINKESSKLRQINIRDESLSNKNKFVDFIWNKKFNKFNLKNWFYYFKMKRILKKYVVYER